MKATIGFIGIAVTITVMVACSSSEQGGKKGKNNNATVCATPLPAPTHFDIKTTVDIACGPGCHDGLRVDRQKLTDEASLYASAQDSLMRLQNGSMPPPGSPAMDVCAKQNLMTYLSQKISGVLPSGTALPTPGPSGCVPIMQPTYLQIQGYVTASCTSCHNAGNPMRRDLSNEMALKAARVDAATRLRNNSMPKAPAMIGQCEEDNLLRYLDSAL